MFKIIEDKEMLYSEQQYTLNLQYMANIQITT